ncbi:hypothetical protein [Nocardia tengchongensis]|uniref:hypothetical protein n=1 Tax=Nocardia tengchongensis TaxID=2055889 RepID=UPI0036084942
MLRVLEAWSSVDYPDVVLFAGGKVPVLEGERVAGAAGRLLDRCRITDRARVRRR